MSHCIAVRVDDELLRSWCGQPAGMVLCRKTSGGRWDKRVQWCWPLLSNERIEHAHPTRSACVRRVRVRGTAGEPHVGSNRCARPEGGHANGLDDPRLPWGGAGPGLSRCQRAAAAQLEGTAAQDLNHKQDASAWLRVNWMVITGLPCKVVS